MIDETTLSVSRTIHISAPVDKVWAAVTEPEHISRWFGRAEFYGTTPGSEGTLVFETRSVPIRIEAVDAPREITYRWSNDDALASLPDRLDRTRSTVFTFTLEPVGDGTQLTVVETGFENTSDPALNLDAHRHGWTVELDKLVALLEGAGNARGDGAVA
ncbi:MAG TPA: SRPBCC domain-containing protein [Rhodoglobus sp.]|nr:SRPBCC domain-containing protein [Rhodoglobus sp.]